MQHISSASLLDLPSRIAYLSSFLNLTPDDGAALNAAKPLIAPLIPAVLDAVYTKLLSFDITAQSFVPKNTDYSGETAKNVQELTLDHPQIALRKDFLKVCILPVFPNRFLLLLNTPRLTEEKNYLVRLVSATDLTPTSSFWVYLNNVGIMHTGLPGFKHREKKPELRVEYIQYSSLSFSALTSPSLKQQL